jgi:hypothetical protein
VGSSLTGARGGARSVKADRRHSVPDRAHLLGGRPHPIGCTVPKTTHGRPSNRRNGTIDPGPSNCPRTSRAGDRRGR